MLDMWPFLGAQHIDLDQLTQKYWNDRNYKDNFFFDINTWVFKRKLNSFNFDFELIAICDIQSHLVNSLGLRYNAVSYTDYKKMIDNEDINFVDMNCYLFKTSVLMQIAHTMIDLEYPLIGDRKLYKEASTKLPNFGCTNKYSVNYRLTRPDQFGYFMRGNNDNEFDTKEQIKKIQDQVGSKKVLCGVSGGVDSSVVATLLAEAIGDQLIPVFVDNGLLRANEREQVEAMFKSRGVNLITVDASETFLSRLAGVSDPETKRKIIGETFIEVFDKEAKKHDGIEFLAQGTLYTDVIESVSVKGPSKTIKSTE
jgi:hypothetical protein